MVAVEAGDHAGHAGADVAAVQAVPAVAEPAHQLGPGASGAAHRPAGRAQRGGEGVPGQGRRDDVEGLARARVDQRLDQVQELGDGTREAVRDQQRLGAGLAGCDVQEVDPPAVDLGRELRVLVKPRLLGAPVVLRAPVPGELLQVAQRHTAGPLHAGQLAWPAGISQPVMQVLDVGLGDLDAEGLHAVAHRASPCPRGSYGRALSQGSCAHAGKTRDNSGKICS